MGILQRFSNIMRSNINALLDKAEDPAKMVDQMLLDLRQDLAEVKNETAGVMADARNAKRQLDECDEMISRYDSAARAALKSGNEGDARELLAKKQQEHVNDITSGGDKARSSMEAFDRMEAKADRMLDAAEAKADLNSGVNSTEELADKYLKGATSPSVDDEIAKMKAEMGL